MQPPESLVSLLDEGIVEEVLRPLMSGKEAQVFLVRSEGELRVAKVYKEASQRSFRQRAEYSEGRTVRNSRDQRAIGKRTKHGREKEEAAWRSAEVDTIYRLRAAGVRVPVPHHFVDGVLIMELVTDAEGNPAPRLGEVLLDAPRAKRIYDTLIDGVVGMLAAGIVHGDLSDFNVLLGADGPVIIDFPQSVDASSNRNARTLLLRDVDNLHRFLARYVPGKKPPPYAQEMWQLYERSELTPDTRLTGRFRPDNALALTDDVLALIAEAERDERRQRAALGIPEPKRGQRTGLRVQQPFGPQSQPHQQPRGRQGQAPSQQGPRGRGPGAPNPRTPTPSHGGRFGQQPPQPPSHGGRFGQQPPQPQSPSSHRGRGGGPAESQRGVPARPAMPTVVVKSQRPGGGAPTSRAPAPQPPPREASRDPNREPVGGVRRDDPSAGPSAGRPRRRRRRPRSPGTE